MLKLQFTQELKAASRKKQQKQKYSFYMQSQ